MPKGRGQLGTSKTNTKEERSFDQLNNWLMLIFYRTAQVTKKLKFYLPRAGGVSVMWCQ